MGVGGWMRVGINERVEGCGTSFQIVHADGRNAEICKLWADWCLLWNNHIVCNCNVRTCACVCVHTCTNILSRTCIYTGINLHPNILMYTYVYVYVDICICMYAHIYIHI